MCSGLTPALLNGHFKIPVVTLIMDLRGFRYYSNKSLHKHAHIAAPETCSADSDDMAV